jgi:hypothetical protein
VPRVPIACSLAADEAGNRIEEWRRLLDAGVAEVERTPGSARLRLHDDGATLLAAIDLARREKACCDFFDFRLVPLPDAVWLEVDAPDDAAGVLDGLVGLR